MPTQVQENITSTAWVDLTTALSLVDGERYLIQNISSVAARLIEAATVPDIDAIGHAIDVGACPWLIVQKTGNFFWVKSDVFEATVVVTDAES